MKSALIKPSNAPQVDIAQLREKYRNHRNTVTDWYNEQLKDTTMDNTRTLEQMFLMTCDGQNNSNATTEEIVSQCSEILEIDVEEFEEHISLQTTRKYDAVYIYEFFKFFYPDNSPSWKTSDNIRIIFDTIKRLSKKIILVDISEHCEFPIHLYKYLLARRNGQNVSFFNDCSYYKRFNFEMKDVEPRIMQLRLTFEQKLNDIPTYVSSAFNEMIQTHSEINYVHNNVK